MIIIRFLQFKKIIIFTLIIIVTIFLIFFYIINSSKQYIETIAPITSCEELNDLLKTNEKIAYLTFDDGPTEKITPKILDILKENNVIATFFVVGKHVKEHPEIVKRTYDEGHYIANHGYTHNYNLLYKDTTSFINEVKATDKEIADALGINEYESIFFRFPEGFMTKKYRKEKDLAFKELQELDYEFVDWNVLNMDSEKKYSNYELIKNLKDSSKNKNVIIILMHDTGDVNNTDLVLEDSINFLKNEGYEFRNFYDFN